MNRLNKTPKLSLGQVIARRVFRKGPKSHGRVVLEIGAPRRVQGWDWACPVRITGLTRKAETPRPIFGIDGLQALQLAMAFARARLGMVTPPLVWLGELGELGLPRAIPEYLPPAARKRLESAIDQESKRFTRVSGGNKIFQDGIAGKLMRRVKRETRRRLRQTYSP